MRVTRFAAVAAVALLLAGCGSSNESATPTASQGGSTASAPASQPAPTLLTRKDVVQQPSGSPQAAVMNVLYWAQWGNWPEVLAAYDRRVRRAIGDTLIVATYQQQRPGLMTTRFSVGDALPTSAGYFVAMQFVSAQGNTVPQSYLLARRENKWLILHDTFFEGTYPSYIQGMTQNQIAPNAKRPSRSALNAAAAAAENLRTTLVPSPR